MQLKIIIIFLLDLLISPFTILAALWLKYVRTYNVGLCGTISPISKIIFKKIGIFPITNHYYDPLIDGSKLKSLRIDRNLPVLTLIMKGKLIFLKKLIIAMNFWKLPAFLMTG